MSRSNKEADHRNESPIEQYYGFNLDIGAMYRVASDSERTEGGEGFVNVPVPFRAEILDHSIELVKFKDNDTGDRVSSTMFRSNNDTVTLRKNDEIIAVGKPGEMAFKNKVNEVKGRRVKRLICMNNLGQIIAIEMKGLAYAAWIEATNGIDIWETSLLEIAGFKDVKTKKGGLKKQPILKFHPSSEDAEEMAIAADIRLQEYLEEYFASSPATASSDDFEPETKATADEVMEKEGSPSYPPVADEEGVDDDLPF